MKHKNLLILPIITLVLMSYSSSNHKDEKPVIAVDRSYLERFELCEGVARWFESDEEMYDIMDKNTAESLRESLHADLLSRK